jgi:glycerate kinase
MARIAAMRNFIPPSNHVSSGMNILVACDSFKDALAADGVCRAIAAGLQKAHPRAQVRQMPLSDGGEGLLEVLRAPLELGWIESAVADPLGRTVTGRYGLSADGVTCVVEMAEASGLQRLTLAERDPLRASTFGTGQQLADAKARGARRAILAIGGSATNDGGIGMAAALGWRFLDAAGNAVTPDGGHLGVITKIIPAAAPFESVEVLCDVTNPLFGPKGAAMVYGRQKGGTDITLPGLDDGLKHLAALVTAQLGKDVAAMPGAGAAGGLGYGAVAFLGATLRRGIEIVLDLTGFDAAAAEADVIITGEGHLDGQSAQGKLIQGLCGRAGGKPVIALCGKLSATPDEIAAIGLKSAFSINAEERPLDEMLANTAANLERTAAALTL